MSNATNEPKMNKKPAEFQALPESRLVGAEGVEQKELEAPEEHELLEAGHTNDRSVEQPTEAQEQATLAQSAREAVDRHAAAGGEIKLNHPEQDTEKTDYQLTRELKDEKYVQVLAQAQTRLNGPQKVLSRAIHQPVVERLSDIAADTIARPSGILGGATGALIGSLVVLFTAKYYGFAYNFLLFVFFFGGGFALGLLLELVVRLTRSR